MAQRTIVEFAVAADPWPAIDAWARETGHTLGNHGEWGRLYQRGDGFFVVKSDVQISPTAEGLHIESWIELWLTGGEMDVAGGSILQYFPRRKARALLNRLLAALGQPPVA